MKLITPIRALHLASSFKQANAVRIILRASCPNVSLETVCSQSAFEEVLVRSTPDVVIAGHGFEGGLEQAHGADPGGAEIPVIVIDAPGDEEVAAGIRMGAATALKNSELEQLPSAIVNAVHTRERGVSGLQESLALEEANHAEALRENQKMVTIGRLTSSIAHEINNPLEAITNLLFLIGTDGELSQGSRSYLQLAQHELQRVVQISTQTLNFSRETASPVRLDLAGLLEEVLVLYSRKIEDKRLTVVREYDAQTLVSVFPGEMRQVFSNLIANAIEASSKDGRLRIRMREARHWGDWEVRGVRVSIADQGSGISPEIRSRICEPFFTTKGQRGTGLGLWVTQSLLQRYGGNLQLHSAVGETVHGTVFSVFLPTNLRPTIMTRPPGTEPTVPADSETQRAG
jgi:two-component system, NtrC family, sensor kinase